MSDFVIVSGDQAIFDASFPPATIIAPPGTMTGTGRGSVNGATVCVEGDEASVVVTGVVYTTPSHPTPGTGMVRITALGGDQVSQNGGSDGRKLIIKGSTFRAEFQLISPAMTTSSPPVPDATPSYSGTGSFVTVNTATRA